MLWSVVQAWLARLGFQSTPAPGGLLACSTRAGGSEAGPASFHPSCLELLAKDPQGPTVPFHLRGREMNAIVELGGSPFRQVSVTVWSLLVDLHLPRLRPGH